MVDVFMALLSFRGFDTPSLPAQGEQRRSSYFNIDRDNSSIRAGLFKVPDLGAPHQPASARRQAVDATEAKFLL
jgi:hypothetical protein